MIKKLTTSQSEGLPLTLCTPFHLWVLKPWSFNPCQCQNEQMNVIVRSSEDHRWTGVSSALLCFELGENCCSPLSGRLWPSLQNTDFVQLRFGSKLATTKHDMAITYTNDFDGFCSPARNRRFRLFQVGAESEKATWKILPQNHLGMAENWVPQLLDGFYYKSVVQVLNFDPKPLEDTWRA